MQNRPRISFPLLSAFSLLLLFSCHRPEYTDTFLRSDERNHYGAYVFDVDFSDTTAYDLFLYTRAEASAKEIRQVGQVLLYVELLSPSGKRYEESVLLPLTKKYSIFAKETALPYRTSCKPVEYGHWQLSIMPYDDKEMLNGIGLKVWERTN